MTDAQETTPALGWMAAREAAAGFVAEFRDDEASSQNDFERGQTRAASFIQDQICALPAPTSAQLLAEAMRLPEIAALVDAAQACVHTSPPHESHVALESALAAIKDASHANG